MLALATLAAQAAQNLDIVVANQVVARIYTGGPYGDLYARQAKIDQRITAVVSSETAREAIFKKNLTLGQSNGRWAVSVAGMLLMEVFPEDAAGASMDPKSLANQWKAGFTQQLPRAVSPMHVPAWWRDENPEPGLPNEPKPSGLGPEDKPLVDAMLGVFDQTRAMEEAQYEQAVGDLQARVLTMIWRYRQGPQCGPAPVTTDPSVRRALNLARTVDADRYRVERAMFVGTTITRVRRQYHIVPGTGPVGPFEEPPEPDPVPPPRMVPGTPIAKALLGTGLDANNRLMNAGQRFPADVKQIMLYLEVKGAPNNTMVGVTFHVGEEIIGRSRIGVSGDRSFAVNFYPEKSATFAPGDYECQLTVADQPAGVIPFKVLSAQ